MRGADDAMYASKLQGRNRFRFSEPARPLTLPSDLR
jgi:hypothetical protein